MNVIFPGSFDPITNGHFELISRCASMFDKVIVALCNNPDKRYLFTFDKRLELVENACEGLNNVEIGAFEGLLIDYAAEKGIKHIVRGVRNAADYSYEAELAGIYYDTGALESIILPSRGEYAHISSGMVRELIRGGHDISRFVPFDIALI